MRRQRPRNGFFCEILVLLDDCMCFSDFRSTVSDKKKPILPNVTFFSSLDVKHVLEGFVTKRENFGFNRGLNCLFAEEFDKLRSEKFQAG